jgi:hypothetical protein
MMLLWCARFADARADGAVVVLDGSRSMWGHVEGTPKYLMVHAAFAARTAETDNSTSFSLVSFGNRSPSSCSDVHVLAEADTQSQSAFLQAIEKFRPWGMTPIARALRTAGRQLGPEPDDRNIILITDGTENCRGDPCAAAAELEAADPATTIDVIALGMQPSESDRLSCIWQSTGGSFHSISSGAELDAAVTAISDRIIGTSSADEMTLSSSLPASEVDAADAAGAEESAQDVAEPLEEPIDFTAAIPESSSFAALPDGVFLYPREQIIEALAAPPPLALPNAVPPIPEINPQWRFRAMAHVLPMDKPSRATPWDGAPAYGDAVLADAALIVPSLEEAAMLIADATEQSPADPVETGSIPQAEQPAADPIETGSIPQSDDGSSPQSAGTANEDVTASTNSQPDTDTVQPGSAPQFDVETNTNVDAQGLRLRAKLTASMGAITRPIEWTVYELIGGDESLWPQVAAVRAAAPEFELPPGDYVVNVQYGHVTATKALSVASGRITDATFVLNAGGLRMLSSLVFVDAPHDVTSTHFVYSGATDENGMRQLIARSEIPGEIIRLNAGVYHLISRLGGANSIVETEVEVSPGVLTAVEINHKAGVLALAVSGEDQGSGEEAVNLQVIDENGNTVTDIDGLSGHAVLAPGAYTVIAQSGGRSQSHEFQIRIGEAVTIDLDLD